MEFIFTFPFRAVQGIENRGSIRPRAVNDPITTLPFFLVILKYYDGSVALLFRLLFSNPKVSFFFYKYFVVFHNRNIVTSLPS